MLFTALLTLASSCFSYTKSVSLTSDLLTLKYRRNFRVGAQTEAGLANSVVGWSVQENQVDRLAGGLSKVLAASVTFTEGGEWLVRRSISDNVKLRRDELEAYRSELFGLVQRSNEFAARFPQRGLARLHALLRTNDPNQLGEHSLNELLPVADLLRSAILKLKTEDLSQLLDKTTIHYSTKPFYHQSQLPIDLAREVNLYRDQALSLAEDIRSRGAIQQQPGFDLRGVLPSGSVRADQKTFLLNLRRVGRALIPQGIVFGEDGGVESGVALGAKIKLEHSEVDNLLLKDGMHPDLKKLSIGNLNHFNQRTTSQWDSEASKALIRSTQFDQNRLFEDPSVADPLKFEVQEAIGMLADWKGAKGWIANCPDEAFEALARSTIGGSVHLPTFERLLQEVGCKVELEEGILLICPARPYLSNLMRWDRDSLRRLAVALKSNKRPLEPVIASCALANLFNENHGLGMLFSRRLSSLTELRADTSQHLCFLGTLGFFGTIPANYLDDWLDGHDVTVPASDLDLEAMYMDQGISAFTGIDDSKNYKLSQCPEATMTPQDNVSPQVHLWATGNFTVLKRLRRYPVQFDSAKIAKEAPAFAESLKAGITIDPDWFAPADAAERNPDRLGRVVVNAADFQDKYLYLQADETLLNYQITFPSGLRSPVFSLFLIRQNPAKPIEFSKLAPEVQEAVLGSFLRPSRSGF